ncbi:alpha-mannosidase [Enterococcus sp. LJL99]
MEHPGVAQVLQVLKQHSFTKIKQIQQFTIQPVDYFQWRQEATGQSSTLEKGIGGMDQHYQIQFSIDPNLVSNKTKNQRFCLMVSTKEEDIWNTNNPQFIVMVNNEIVRGLDLNHHYLLLESALPEYDIKMNVYTNTAKEEVFIESWLCLRNDLVFELYHQIKALTEVLAIAKEADVSVWSLYQLMDQLVQQIELVDTTSPAFEQSLKKISASLTEWYATLDSKMEAQVTEYIVGHTHIDISWLWTLKQTREKVIRSFSNAVYLLEKYPEMTFMSSTPLLYEMLEQEAPELFEKVCRFEKEGRWEVEGGMYVESDLNLPSGESLIRQLLYGKLFFKEKFGRESSILWLPDCFGFTASLPQIMKKAGIQTFFTSKLDWNEENKLPNDTFYWQGIDGSQVLTYLLTTSDYAEDFSIGTTYNGRLNASQVKGTWSRFRNKPLTNKVLQLYGFGDGGGGPTEEMLEYGKVFSHAIPTMPKVEHSVPSKFFKDFSIDLVGKKVPNWVGELYLETHRGVYTTDGRLKKANQQIEVKLLQVEFIRGLLFLAGYPILERSKQKLTEAWKKVLINQFHDILPGTSIREVHDEAMLRYQEADEQCDELWNQALKTLQLQPITPSPTTFSLEECVVINTSSFPRTTVLPTVDGDRLLKNIPALGLKIIDANDLVGQKETNSFKQKENEWSFETPFYFVELNKQGEFTYLYDKELAIDLFEIEAGNQWLLYPDRPQEFDAWNIDESSLLFGKRVASMAKIEVEFQSAYRLVLRVQREVGQSKMVQKIIFYAHTKRIDFQTTVDWRESGVLLKVKFPTPVITGYANYGIQFGNLERPTHQNTSWEQAKYEVCGHLWADLSEQAYGVAVLCPEKYGYQIEGQAIYLSLLRSPNDPAEGIDLGQHEFTYALFPHLGDFRKGEVYQEAYDLAIPLRFALADKQFSLEDQTVIKISEKNIICESIKLSENERQLIVRCYEANGQTTTVELEVPWLCKTVTEVSLLEEVLEDTEKLVKKSAKGYHLRFTPYEIKTLAIDL